MNPHELRQIGRYPVIRFIAEGGMSWVFEVEDPRLGVRRALKMLKPGVSVGGEHQRFSNEAGLLARIEHPNLIRVYDFALDPETNCHYYTMSLIDGPVLSETRLDPDQAVAVFEGILTGLSVLHDAGIVHRDLKPGNILLTHDGRPVLIDLGIAKQEGTAGVTQFGRAIGTMLFMPPEQAQGKIAGPRSDVFSAGLTLYRLLTGKSVYESIEEVDTTSNESIVYYLAALKHGNRELDVRFPPEVTPPIASLIRRACRFNPDDRYVDAHEMLRALRIARSGIDPELDSTAEVPAVEAAGRSGRSISGRQLLLAGALVAAVVVAVPLVLNYLDRNALQRALTESSELSAEVQRLIDATAALDPPPDSGSIDGLRSDVASGVRLQERSQEGLEAGEYEEGLTRAQLAIQIMNDACQRLTDSDLRERAQSLVSGLRQRSDDLGRLGAAEIRPEPYARLGSALAALAAPSPDLAPCETSRAYHAEIGQAGQALALATTLEQELEVAWPELAAAARRGALESRDAPGLAASDAPEIRKILTAAGDTFAEGERLLGAGEYLAARNAFSDSRHRYADAALALPAVRARARVDELQQQLREESISQLGEAAETLETAETALANARWSESQSGFERTAALMEQLLSNRELDLSARAQAEAVRETAERAISAGAERSAPAEFAEAGRIEGRALEALERKDYAAAAGLYAESDAAYVASADAAEGALESARRAGEGARAARNALLKGSGCGDLPEPVRPYCAGGNDKLGKGDQALDSLDAPTATSEFESATEQFAKASVVRDEYARNLPRPPETVAREPLAAAVSAFRNETLRFRVDAVDPNGDELAYEWSANGTQLPERSNSLEWRPDVSSEIAVRVHDPSGEQVAETWKVEVVNRAPTLTATPSAQKAVLEPGETLTFEADASDPDGDELVTQFYVDGREVGNRGDRQYRFAPSRPGEYTISASVHDEQQATAKREWRVRVNAPPPPAPPPETARVEPPKPKAAPATVARAQPQPPTVRVDPPKPAARPEPVQPQEKPRVETPEPGPPVAPPKQVARAVPPKPPVPTPPPPPDLPQIARSVLGEYRKAYESRNIARLDKIWAMNSTQRQSMKVLFDGTSSIEVAIRELDIDVADDAVALRFEQRVKSSGGIRLPGDAHELTATIRQDGGQWVIAELEGKR